MLTDTSRWSHARGNEVVPYRWQATGRVHERGRRWASWDVIECGWTSNQRPEGQVIETMTQRSPAWAQ